MVGDISRRSNINMSKGCIAVQALEMKQGIKMITAEVYTCPGRVSIGAEKIIFRVSPMKTLLDSKEKGQPIAQL